MKTSSSTSYGLLNLLAYLPGVGATFLWGFAYVPVAFAIALAILGLVVLNRTVRSLTPLGAVVRSALGAAIAFVATLATLIDLGLGFGSVLFLGAFALVLAGEWLLTRDSMDLSKRRG